MLFRPFVTRSPLVLLAILGIIACGEQAETPVPGAAEMTETDRIEGQVVYRERIALPPEARVEVQLQDISKADALATVLASVALTPASGPPYPFAIEYEPAQIDPRMRYALRATITLGDRLMFTTTEYIDPFSGNPIEVLVQRVAESVKAPAAPLEANFWVLDTLEGEKAGTGMGTSPGPLSCIACGRVRELPCIPGERTSLQGLFRMSKLSI